MLFLVFLSLLVQQCVGIWLYMDANLETCNSRLFPFGADNPGPYTVTVHEQATGDLLETWPVKNDKTDFEWTIDLPVGAAVYFTLEDSAGLQATGYDQTIVAGSGTACLFKNAGIEQANIEKHFAEALAAVPKTTASPITPNGPPPSVSVDPPAPEPTTSNPPEPTSTSVSSTPKPTTSSTSRPPPVSASKSSSTTVSDVSEIPASRSAAPIPIITLEPADPVGSQSASSVTRSSASEPPSDAQPSGSSASDNEVTAEGAGSTASSSEENSNSPNIALIVGISAGAVVAFLIIAFFIWRCCCHTRKASNSTASLVPFYMSEKSPTYTEGHGSWQQDQRSVGSGEEVLKSPLQSGVHIANPSPRSEASFTTLYTKDGVAVRSGTPSRSPSYSQRSPTAFTEARSTRYEAFPIAPTTYHESIADAPAGWRATQRYTADEAPDHYALPLSRSTQIASEYNGERPLSISSSDWRTQYDKGTAFDRRTFVTLTPEDQPY